MNGLIFLDFDGVLNNTSNMDLRIDDEMFSKFHIINEKLNYVSVSNIIPMTELFIFCLRHDIKIVISSSWSVFGLEKIKTNLSEVFGRYLLDKLFISTTPYLIKNELIKSEHIRTLEIIRWMKEHNYSDRNYLIIDDELSLFSKYDIDNRLIITDSKLGFTINDLETVKRFFNLHLYKNKPNIIETIDKNLVNNILKLENLNIRERKNEN